MNVIKTIKDNKFTVIALIAITLLAFLYMKKESMTLTGKRSTQQLLRREERNSKPQKIYKMKISKSK